MDMKDEDKTKEQLIEELVELRRRNTGLEALGVEYKGTETKDQRDARSTIENQSFCTSFRSR